MFRGSVDLLLITVYQNEGGTVSYKSCLWPSCKYLADYYWTGSWMRWTLDLIQQGCCHVLTMLLAATGCQKIIYSSFSSCLFSVYFLKNILNVVSSPDSLEREKQVKSKYWQLNHLLIVLFRDICVLKNVLMNVCLYYFRRPNPQEC